MKLPSKIDEPFLLTLLDSLPEPVVYHVPVWKESNGIKTIIDFEIIYCNEESARMTGIPIKILIGQRVTTMIASDPGVRTKLFEQIMHVYNTGDDAEVSYYNPVLKKHFHLLRKKIEDGVYTIGHKLTPEIQFRQETERQTEIANSIFDASLNGVYAMEAVRNDSNKIIDFVFIKVNKRFADLLGKSVEEIIGERYLSLFSSSIENGLFYLQCQVVYTEKLIWSCEDVTVYMTHIGGHPKRYAPGIKQDLINNKAKLFICGHSHILKVMYDDKIGCLHMNPGAAGKQGWHAIRTLLRFTIDGANIKDCEVIELGKR